MSIVDFFRRRKKEKQTWETQAQYEEEHREEPEEYEEPKESKGEIFTELVDFARFNQDDFENYVKGQCEVIEDTMKYMDNLRNEYDTVTEYFSDVQVIDTAPESIRKEVDEKARLIADLMVDRRMYKGSENRLSNYKYAKMESAQPEMPGVLAEMQNNESYLNTVKKDMRLLEGEQMALRYDIRDLQAQKKALKQMGLLIISVLTGILLLLLVLTLAEPSKPNYMFLVMCTLAAAAAAVMFSVNRSIEKKTLITRRKLARCVTLLNKVKIKYVNVANTLDYQCAKYSVKNSYDFGRQYEMYLNMKAEQKKMMKMTEELNEAEEELVKILHRLNLNDPEIWLKQVKALTDPREMVEIRHNLSIRRQKLRSQIEYNKKKLEEYKGNIRRVTVNHPQYKEEALRLLEKYESRSDY